MKDIIARVAAGKTTVEDAYKLEMVYNVTVHERS